MRFYGHRSAVRVHASVEKLSLMLALLEEKLLVSDPEKGLRIVGGEVFRAFHSFSHDAIKEAIREAQEERVSTAVLVGVPLESAEEAARLAASSAGDRDPADTIVSIAAQKKGLPEEQVAVLRLAEYRTDTEIERDELFREVASLNGALLKATRPGDRPSPAPVEDVVPKLTLDEARDHLKAKGYLDPADLSEPAQPVGATPATTLHATD